MNGMKVLKWVPTSFGYFKDQKKAIDYWVFSFSRSFRRSNMDLFGVCFQFVQSIILLKNQVLTSKNGYDLFNSLLNSIFSQFITHGTILGIIQKWKNKNKKCLFKCGIMIMWAGCVFYSWYVAIRLYSTHAPQLCIIHNLKRIDSIYLMCLLCYNGCGLVCCD